MPRRSRIDAPGLCTMLSAGGLRREEFFGMIPTGITSFVAIGGMDISFRIVINPYKSILRQEDAYLLELVRTIHLNPIRARIVEDMEALGEYPFAGHSAILGRVKRDWQDTRGILRAQPSVLLGSTGSWPEHGRGFSEAQAFIIRGKSIGKGR